MPDHQEVPVGTAHSVGSAAGRSREGETFPASWAEPRDPRATITLLELRFGQLPLSLGHTGRWLATRVPQWRINCVTWIKFPQVSFNLAIFEPVTCVGGIVNSAPRAFMRS